MRRSRKYLIALDNSLLVSHPVISRLFMDVWQSCFVNLESELTIHFRRDCSSQHDQIPHHKLNQINDQSVVIPFLLLLLFAPLPLPPPPACLGKFDRYMMRNSEIGGARHPFRIGDGRFTITIKWSYLVSESGDSNSFRHIFIGNFVWVGSGYLAGRLSAVRMECWIYLWSHEKCKGNCGRNGGEFRSMGWWKLTGRFWWRSSRWSALEICSRGRAPRARRGTRARFRRKDPFWRIRARRPPPAGFRLPPPTGCAVSGCCCWRAGRICPFQIASSSGIPRRLDSSLRATEGNCWLFWINWTDALALEFLFDLMGSQRFTRTITITKQSGLKRFNSGIPHGVGKE